MRNSRTIHSISMLLLAAAAQSQTTPPSGGPGGGSRADGSGAPPTQTVLMAGDAAPDGNGTIGGFGYPTINNQGDVALVVTHNGSQNPSLDYSAIYLANPRSATILVRGGDPSPDGNGVFEYFGYEGNFLEQVVLNDNGSVAFAAYLDQTSGGDDVDTSGIFSANAIDGVTQHVRNTDPAPDGNGFFGPPASDPFGRSLSLPGLDNADQVSFYALLNNTSGGEFFDDRGIFRAEGMTVSKLLRVGQPEPAGPETVAQIHQEFGSNLTGQVAIEALLPSSKKKGRSGDGPPPVPVDRERIYVANEALVLERLRSGGAPPIGDGVIVGGFNRTRIADNGGLTFLGSVAQTADPLDSGRRLFFHGGLFLQEIVRQGQFGPGETEPFTFSDFPGLDSNSREEVAFSAILSRNAVPPDNRTTAIYRWRGGNILTVAVHEGDPVPDGNGTFGDLAQPVFLNNGGQIAFAAEVEGANPPPAIGNDVGIFVIDSSGTIHQVARNGYPLAGSTVLIPVFLGSFDFNGDSLIDDADLRLAGMNAINDSGEVPFWAGLGDGSQGGLFVWRSPEVISLDMEDGTFGEWDVSP